MQNLSLNVIIEGLKTPEIKHAFIFMHSSFRGKNNFYSPLGKKAT